METLSDKYKDIIRDKANILKTKEHRKSTDMPFVFDLVNVFTALHKWEKQHGFHKGHNELKPEKDLNIEDPDQDSEET
eukprot:8563622-Ditylum_brightwellii.AAC.1